MENQLLELKRKFEEKIKEKTSWGRNELQIAFNGLLLEVSQGARIFESSHENPVKNPVKTGEVKFKFSNEESVKAFDVYDNKSFVLTLQQPIKESNDNIRAVSSSVTFISKSGNEFKLFMEKI